MITFREIKNSDNKILADIIRKSLEAHDLAKPGTVYTDPTTDDLFDLFREEGSVYFVAEDENGILGGCGIYPTPGLPRRCAELVKLYLREEARGKKLGFALMTKALEWAKENGYTQIYLETFAELASAVGLYKKLGFYDLQKPMGESGHHACQIWMLKELTDFRTDVFTKNSPLYPDSLSIRQEVFIKEQEIDPKLEIDEYENECTYFLTSINDIPASTGRLRISREKIKFERIATLKAFRGKHCGKELMQKMLLHARTHHPELKPYMHAQMSAVSFYESIGWVKVGEEFDEAGIPHFAMTVP
jgi:putative acetyltransferase